MAGKGDDRLRDMLGNKKFPAPLLVVSKRFKLKISVLYTYNLKKQAKSKAVRFVYCLKGRGDEPGIVKECNGRWLAPGCFIVPIKSDKEIMEVFAFWKIPCKRTVILTN